MNGAENNDKTKIKTMFSRGCFIFLGDDFGGLILYLGFLGLHWEVWSASVGKERGTY